MESAAVAQARAAVDLAILGVLADGGLRRSEAAALIWPDGTARLTVQKGKNHPEPATVALTEAPARALRDLQPDDADPATPVFGLTGEALANRVRAAARAAGLGHGFTGHSGRIGMARRMVAAGAPNAAVQRQGRRCENPLVCSLDTMRDCRRHAQSAIVIPINAVGHWPATVVLRPDVRSGLDHSARCRLRASSLSRISEVGRS